MMSTPVTTFDFLSGALDPRINFTRPDATATRVNSSGYIEVVLADVPRFDYNPVSKSLRGILIEGASTNVQPRSQEFDNNTVWEKSGTATVTANQIAAPDNTVTADLFRCGATSASEVRRNNITLAAGTHTFSVFARKEVSDFIVIQVQDTATASFRRVWFNVNLGTTGSAASAGTNIAFLGSRIQAYENGFYRVSITVSLTAGTVTGRTNIFLSEGNGVFSGNALSGIYIWGAQLETDELTSYIPTVAAAVTRNADIATITGANFSDWWVASQGGVTANFRPSNVSGTRPIIQYDDGTANEIITLRGNTTNPELYIVDGGTPQAQIDAGTIAANTDYSLTGWWQTNDCRAKLSSGAQVIDNTATIPTVTQARIGSDGTNYLNGHIATISYYDSFTSQIYNRRKNKTIFSLM